MLRLLEARVDELAGRVRQLEAALGVLAETDRPPPCAETDVKHHLNAPEAALYLGVSQSLLARWRSDLPGGPPFIRVGRRILYAVADLEFYLSARRQGPLR